MTAKILRVFPAAMLLLFVARAAWAAAPAPAAKSPPASRFRHATETITVLPDGRFTRTVHNEIQVMNTAAAMHVGQISLGYDTALQSLKIVEAHTLKKDGTTIPVPPSAIYDRAAPGAARSPMFTEFHVKTIVFPQFAAGDTAVYTVRYIQKKALLPDQFWYDDILNPQISIDDLRETITAPADMDLHVENRGVDFSKTRQGNKIVYSWHYAAPNPAPPEARLAVFVSDFPHFVATTFPSYKALGRSYAQMEEPKIVVTPAIRKLADRITKGISGRRDQAKTLYEWVSSNIRYVAVELGRGSFVPHAAQTVLTNGYGDCKDHVVLLAALLKAKGIKSEGVLINANKLYDLTKVPSFEGLNHIITYLPAFDLYLDSTAAVAPFGVLPIKEYGKPAVYASSTDPHRGTTPILPQGLAEVKTVTTAHLTKDGTLTGTTTTTGTGPYSVVFRKFGLIAESIGPDNIAAKILAARGYGGDATGTLITPDPMKPAPSYTLTGHFTAQGWTQQAAGALHFELPRGMTVVTAIAGGPMGIPGDRSVKADEDIPCYSTHGSQDLSLTAPKGMQFGHVPADVHVKTPYLRFDAHWTLTGHTMRVQRDFTSQIGQALCTPQIRKANKAALDAIYDDESTQLSLHPSKAATQAANAVHH